LPDFDFGFLVPVFFSVLLPVSDIPGPAFEVVAAPVVSGLVSVSVPLLGFAFERASGAVASLVSVGSLVSVAVGLADVGAGLTAGLTFVAVIFGIAVAATAAAGVGVVAAMGAG